MKVETDYMKVSKVMERFSTKVPQRRDSSDEEEKLLAELREKR